MGPGVRPGPEHTERTIKVGKEFEYYQKHKGFQAGEWRDIICDYLFICFYYESCQVENESERGQNRLTVRTL